MVYIHCFCGTPDTVHSHFVRPCFRSATLWLGWSTHQCHESFPPAKSRAPNHATHFRVHSLPLFPSPRFRQLIPTRSDCRPPFAIFASHPTSGPQSEPPWRIPHIPLEDNAAASQVADHVTDTKPCACQTTASSGQLPGRSRPRGFQPPFLLLSISYIHLLLMPLSFYRTACSRLLSFPIQKWNVCAHCILFRLSPLILFGHPPWLHASSVPC